MDETSATKSIAQISSLSAAAAANGSNHIALRCPPLPGITYPTCADDRYWPSCHSFTPRRSPLDRLPVFRLGELGCSLASGFRLELATLTICSKKVPWPGRIGLVESPVRHEPKALSR